MRVPPLPEQRAIAAYLDRETARLDALIAAKQRLLDLLTEKRRALITHAVTRGLNSDAPLRDSGVAWLGPVPGHWEVDHLKRVLSQIDYGISESIGVDGQVAVLRMGDISEGRIVFTDVGFVYEVEPDLLLQKGDLVFNRTNSLDQIGKVGLFEEPKDYPVSFASYLVRLRCSQRVLPEFLTLLLNSQPILAWARREALPAIGQANLNPNRYGFVPIPVPPITEQRAIVRHIAANTAKLDALRTAAEHTLGLLHERRAALIAEAVTGKLCIHI